MMQKNVRTVGVFPQPHWGAYSTGGEGTTAPSQESHLLLLAFQVLSYVVAEVVIKIIKIIGDD